MGGKRITISNFEKLGGRVIDNWVIVETEESEISYIVDFINIYSGNSSNIRILRELKKYDGDMWLRIRINGGEETLYGLEAIRTESEFLQWISRRNERGEL